MSYDEFVKGVELVLTAAAEKTGNTSLSPAMRRLGIIWKRCRAYGVMPPKDRARPVLALETDHRIARNTLVYPKKMTKVEAAPKVEVVPRSQFVEGTRVQHPMDVIYSGNQEPLDRWDTYREGIPPLWSLHGSLNTIMMHPNKKREFCVAEAEKMTHHPEVKNHSDCHAHLRFATTLMLNNLYTEAQEVARNVLKKYGKCPKQPELQYKREIKWSGPYDHKLIAKLYFLCGKAELKILQKNEREDTMRVDRFDYIKKMLEDFSESIKSDPSSAEAHLGLSLAMKEELGKAIREHRQVMDALQDELDQNRDDEAWWNKNAAVIKEKIANAKVDMYYIKAPLNQIDAASKAAILRAGKQAAI